MVERVEDIEQDPQEPEEEELFSLMQAGVAKEVDTDFDISDKIKTPTGVVNILKNVRDDVDRIRKVIELRYPEMIHWWLYDDPLIQVFGEMSVGISVLTEEKFKEQVWRLLSKEEATIFFRLPNCDEKIKYLKDKFHHVDFNTLLSAKK